MPSTPVPKLQLRKNSSFFQVIRKLQHEGKAIPPKWLDSSLRNEKLFSPLALSKASVGIEREIEQALYGYYKSLKTGALPLQKVLGNSPRIAFTFKNEHIDAVTVKELYQQLSLKLLHSSEGLELELTPEQFAQIRPSISHLMYFHGNQTLTSAPYFMGGIANIVLFQWGNLFGVAKFTASPSEKAIIGNLLIYFEDLEDRTMEECVFEYQQQHGQLIKELTAPALIMPEPIPVPTTVIETPEPSLTVPTLSLRLTPPLPWSKEK